MRTVATTPADENGKYHQMGKAENPINVQQESAVVLGNLPRYYTNVGSVFGIRRRLLQHIDDPSKHLTKTPVNYLMKKRKRRRELLCSGCRGGT